MPTDEIIKNIMAETFAVDAASITEGFSTADADLWDSLNTLRMVTALEEAFQIRFSMEEIATMSSFSAVQQAVSKNGGGQPTS